MNIVKGMNYKIVDHGCSDEKSCHYPVFAKKVACAVIKDSNSLGILICGTGIGIGITANKISGVRLNVCHDYSSALLAKK